MKERKYLRRDESLLAITADQKRPNCPDYKKVDHINNVGTTETFVPSFASYLSKAQVNGINMTVLCDTGSSIHLISARVIKPENYNREAI